MPSASCSSEISPVRRRAAARCFSFNSAFRANCRVARAARANALSLAHDWPVRAPPLASRSPLKNTAFSGERSNATDAFSAPCWP